MACDLPRPSLVERDLGSGLQGLCRWRDPDSNRGHHDFQSCALPTELSRRGAERVAPHAGPGGPTFRAMGRRIGALIAIAVVAFAALAVVLAKNSGKDDSTPKTKQSDTRAEALAYAPKASPALVGVDTGSPQASLVLGALVSRATGGALTANDISPLLGNEAVVALLDPRTGRAQLSMVAKDPDALRELARRLKKTGSYKDATLYSGPQGAVVAIKGGTLLAASDEPTVRRALDTAADPQAHPTPQDFDRRLAGLPTTADVRTVFDPKRIVVAQRLPGIGNTRWGRSLTNGAAVLQEGGPGLSLPFVLQTDAARINDNDLPFATGAQPPQIRGRGPLLLGVNDPGQLIAFLRKVDPDRFGGLDSFQSGLPSFLRVDVNGLLNGLTNDGTISSDDGLDHFPARPNPPDPSDWTTPLDRLSTLSGVLQRLGIDNIKLTDEGKDAYRLDVDGDLALRAGVFGPTLVLTDDADTNLRATAAAPQAPTPDGARGGLTLRMRASEGRRLLTDLFGLPAGAGAVLDRLGDLTGWARAATDSVRGELDLGLR